ncbi:MAG: aminotransferase class IV [Gudongella sp.]|nr:aminotransferase class IV [Gudongella sp.]
MKNEAIMKKYIVNGEVFDSQDGSVFKSISKSPIYEVVRVVDKAALFLDSHLDRMFKSADLIGYDIGFLKEKIESYVAECININDIGSNNIKLVAVEDDNNKKLFLIYSIQSFYPSKSYYEQGVKTIVFEHTRDNPNAKIQHTDFKERVKEAMDSNDAFEALLVDSEGFILEGSRSNMFYVLNNQLYTAPSDLVLLGITREHILSLSGKLGYRVVEQKLHKDDLKNIDGLFISGTSTGVLPVSTIGDLQIPTMKNKIILDLIDGYDKLIHKTFS